MLYSSASANIKLGAYRLLYTSQDFQAGFFFAGGGKDVAGEVTPSRGGGLWACPSPPPGILDALRLLLGLEISC